MTHVCLSRSSEDQPELALARAAFFGDACMPDFAPDLTDGPEANHPRF